MPLPVLLVFAFLTLSLPARPDEAREAVLLENGQLEVWITPCIDLVRAGSLIELTDIQTGLDLVDYHQFGGLQSGSLITADGEIACLSDTEAVFCSPGLLDYGSGATLPIQTEITYRLVGRGLEMEVEVGTTGPAELWDPLEMDFHVGCFDTLHFGNQTCVDRTAVLGQGLGLYRISGDQVVRCVRSDGQLNATFVFPNPAKAILALNEDPPPCDNYLSLRIFDVEPPRENCVGPDLHSALPPDSSYSFFVRLELGDGFCPAYFSMHPDGYERTASWIMDEIPFIHPEQGYIWDFSESSSGDEYVSAWLIALLESHPQMSMNWLILPDGIFDLNADSMWFEPGYEESWSHWHSTWRVSTEATQEFLDWLLKIQNNVYPWANRVRLGCHGYHHTPNPDSTSGSLHEFITYEPAEHLERFSVSDQDLLDMGLSLDSLRVIRFPGHRTSLSGLYATIAHGYEFYCNGVRWYEEMGGEPFYDLYLSRYETPEGRLWGTNTVWWGDYPSAYPCEYLSTVMDRGKHALMGAHPISMWDLGNPSAYDRIDSLCTSLEQDYEHFGWVLPIRYGRFLEETYRISVGRMRTGSSHVEMVFAGSTGRGQCIVVEVPSQLPPESVTIDGQPVPYELRPETRLFVECGALSPGEHTLLVQFAGTGIEPDVPETSSPPRLTCNPNPFTASVVITGRGFSPGSVLRIYDLGGRLVLEESFTGSFLWSVAAASPGLPPGLYIVQVSGGKRDDANAISASARLILL